MRRPAPALLLLLGFGALLFLARGARAQNATGPSPGDDVSFRNGSYSGPVTAAGVVSAPGFDGGWGKFSALNVSGPSVCGSAVSAPLFDGGSAVLSGTLGVAGVSTFASTVHAPSFDGGTATLSSTLALNGTGTCVSVTQAGCDVDFGPSANDYCESVAGSIVCRTDFESGGFVAAVTAGQGFRSTGSTTVVLQGFPNSGTGVRLNAGTALGGTAGDQLVQIENGSVAKAAVVPSGAYVVLGGLPARVGAYFPTETTSTAFTAVGLPSPSLLAGTPTASNADTTYQAINFQTGGSNGDASGYAGPFTTLRITQLPRVYNVARTDPSDVTSTRLAFGFAASALEGVSTLAGANGIRGCWFRFDTGLSDTTWQAVSSDGTTASATDTTISVAAATTYVLLVDAALATGTCRYYVNGVLKVSKSTNIPTGSTALGLQGSVTTLTNAARNVAVARTRLEQL